MAVTPSGSQSVPIDKLRDLLKDSSNFRTWTGTATAVLAKSRVYPFMKPRSGVIWPHCVVGWMPRGWSTDHPMREFTRSLSMFVTFEAIIAKQGEPEDTYTFTNAIGPILTDMWINAADGTVDRLDLVGLSLIEGPLWENEDLATGEGDIIYARYLVEAGTP